MSKHLTIFVFALNIHSPQRMTPKDVNHDLLNLHYLFQHSWTKESVPKKYIYADDLGYLTLPRGWTFFFFWQSLNAQRMIPVDSGDHRTFSVAAPPHKHILLAHKIACCIMEQADCDDICWSSPEKGFVQMWWLYGAFKRSKLILVRLQKSEKSFLCCSSCPTLSYKHIRSFRLKVMLHKNRPQNDVFHTV